MKCICQITGAVTIVFFLCITDIPYLSEKLAPEAQAFWGRGAAFVVGAAAGSAVARSSGSAASQQQAAAAQQQAASAQQQATAAQQQAAASQQQAAAAQQQAAASQSQAGASGGTLPVGTVVSSLPAGCTPTPIGGVTYYYCGGNFYQAVYEGSTLKYVTTKPK
jgi:biotin carboxyl carrier protein